MTKIIEVVVYKSVSDEEKLAKYAALAGPAMAATGGRILARGMPVAVKEAVLVGQITGRGGNRFRRAGRRAGCVERAVGPIDAAQRLGRRRVDLKGAVARVKRLPGTAKLFVENEHALPADGQIEIVAGRDGSSLGADVVGAVCLDPADIGIVVESGGEDRRETGVAGLVAAGVHVGDILGYLAERSGLRQHAEAWRREKSIHAHIDWSPTSKSF